MANIEFDSHVSLQLNDIKDTMIELKDRSQVDSNHTEYVVGGTIAAGGTNEQLVLRRVIIDKANTPPAPNTLPDLEETNNKPAYCCAYRGSNGWEYLWHYALNELNIPYGNVDFNNKKLIKVAPGEELTDGVNLSQLESATFGLIPQDPVRATHNDPADLSGVSVDARFLIGKNEFGNDPVGDWADKTGQIATKTADSWTYEEPQAGWLMLNYRYYPPTSVDFEAADPCMMAYNDEVGVEEWKIIYTGLIYTEGDGIDISVGTINASYDDISITTDAAGTQNGGTGNNVNKLKVKLPDSGVLSSNDGDGGVVLNYDTNTLESFAGTFPNTKNYLAVKAAGIIEAGAGLTSSVTNRKTIINAVATDESILVGADSFGVQFGGALKTLKLNGGANPGTEVKLDPLTMEVTANGISAKNPRLFYIDTEARTHTARTGEVVYPVTHGLLTRQVKVTVYKLDSGGEIVGVIYPRININGTNTVQVCITNQLSTFDFKVAVEA